MGEKSLLKVGGKSVPVSSLEKVLFPKTGFTKAQVLDYYIRVSSVILPHLKDRPLTLKLYLHGIGAPAQYIKNVPDSTPRWIKIAPVWRKSHESKIRYVLVNNLATLVWTVNRYNVEMHTFLAKAPQIQRPTTVVFDLDPGPPATVLDCARVALVLKEKLESVGLECFAKSSGSKGIHVWAPLNTKVTYDQTQALAKHIAEQMSQEAPEQIETSMAKSARGGKVFIDYSQNADFKSTACVYSLRARENGPFVSIPLAWREIRDALKAGEHEAFFVGPGAALTRIEREGDLFAPVLNLKQKFPADFADRLSARPAKKVAAPKAKKVSPRMPGALEEYARKRDFTKTQEPSGARSKRLRAAAAPKQKQRSFVIQKHAASHLHYDFRLEMEGVLRSWAVPKGPPLVKGQSRLAMHVEDHPLEYGSFEGTIPKGQYGGGTVMLWDYGTYQVKDPEPPSKGFYAGKLHLILSGKKLKGEWVLVKVKSDTDRFNARGNAWYLVKVGENAKPISTKRDDQSVVSGRTMAEIGEQNTAQWQSNR